MTLPEPHSTRHPICVPRSKAGLCELGHEPYRSSVILTFYQESGQPAGPPAFDHAFVSNPGSVPSPIRRRAVRKLIAIIVLSLSLTGCGVVNTLVDTFTSLQAVRTDLE